MNVRMKAKILKQYEVYCYQVAYYLLGCEEKAAQAASRALLEVAQDERFYEADDGVRRGQVKRAAMKSSLQSVILCKMYEGEGWA